MHCINFFSRWFCEELGIGVGFELIKDASPHLRVNEVFEKSPASKAGVQVGDRIIAVGDTAFARFASIEDAVAVIRGEANTKLCLSVMRKGKKERLCATREDITVPPVKVYTIANSAFLEFHSFSMEEQKAISDAFKIVENKDTVVIGEESVGMTLVKSPIPVPGQAFSLLMDRAELMDVDGAIWHGKTITPDIVVPNISSSGLELMSIIEKACKK